MLALLGSMVKTTIRSSDIAGRYGGEEFLIVLPDTAINRAFMAAEKLKSKINSTPVMIADRYISVSAADRKQV